MSKMGCWLFIILGVFSSLVNQSSGAATGNTSAGANVVHPNAAAHWSYYGLSGPDHWSTDSPDCAYRRQSPIDVITTQAVLDDRLDEINIALSNNDAQNQMAAISNSGISKNNGHSVYAKLSSAVLRLSGGNLRNSYRVDGVHFHWGVDDTQGSEHTVDGAKYPLEIHMVSYDEEHFGSILDALNAVKANDSLAVIGQLFQISEIDNPQLTPLINVLGNLTTSGSTAPFVNFDLKKLFPSRLTEYYRYAGSLTTPPCFEKVVWTVLRTVNNVSKSQLAKFRALQLDGPAANRPPVQSNWRAVQPLNGRTVYKSFVNTKLSTNLNVNAPASTAFTVHQPVHIAKIACLITVIYCHVNRYRY